MPLYEYRCDACGHHFEKIQKFSDPPIDVCPNCGARQVQKLLSSPAIQFKGSGWYITDYARKGTDGKEGKEAAAKTDGKDAKPAGTESKAAGTESKSTASDSSSSSSSSGSTSPPPTTSSSKS
jgi:putative FmdB family regulatory protein